MHRHYLNLSVSIKLKIIKWIKTLWRNEGLRYSSKVQYSSDYALFLCQSLSEAFYQLMIFNFFSLYIKYT